MKWEEHFERLTKHYQKHRDNQNIPQNHILPACNICFKKLDPQKAFLNREFHGFINEVLPEAEAFTEQTGRDIATLIATAGRNTEAQKHKDNLIAQTKRVLLGYSYSIAPQVEIEQLSRII